MNSNTSKFSRLMDDVSGRWGFCGSIKYGRRISVSDIIPQTGPVSAEQFMEWAFLAEDMNPREDMPKFDKVKQQIKDAFIEHMGSETVDASELRY